MSQQPEHQQQPTITPIQRPLPRRPLRAGTEDNKRFAGRLLLTGCAIVYAVILVISYRQAARDDARFQQLQQTGIVAHAHVTSREGLGHGSVRMNYQFTPEASKTVFTGSSATEHDELIESPDLDIIYDPTDPTNSALKDDFHGTGGLATRVVPFCFFGWPFTGTGLFLFFGGRYRLRQAQALEQRGVVVQGVIVDRWYQRGKMGGNSIAFTFPVVHPNGNIYTSIGAQVIDTFTGYQRAQIGTTVQVRYLPDNLTLYQLEE